MTNPKNPTNTDKPLREQLTDAQTRDLAAALAPYGVDLIAALASQSNEQTRAFITGPLPPYINMTNIRIHTANVRSLFGWKPGESLIDAIARTKKEEAEQAAAESDNDQAQAFITEGESLIDAIARKKRQENQSMPITRIEAQAVFLAFTRDYPGALELAYHFGESIGELFGDHAAEVPAGLKGAYLPKKHIYKGRPFRGGVYVPLGNIDDAADLLVTLRHEVLGHHGANTFAPTEKRALLDGIIAAREQPGIKESWEYINRCYAGTSVDVRAEEVWALHSEILAPAQHLGQAQVRKHGDHRR